MKRAFFVSSMFIMLCGCSTTPDIGNDPHSGGFFGGVRGLFVGDYDARQQQRQETLAALDSGNTSLRAQSDQLNTEKNEKAARVKKQRQEVAKLNSNVKALAAKVDNLKGTQKASNVEVKELRTRVDALQGEATKLDSISSSPSEERLTAEKEMLEREYQALMKAYLALIGT
jgi:uncharacterized coiled-coil DUF342 family protein